VTKSSADTIDWNGEFFVFLNAYGDEVPDRAKPIRTEHVRPRVRQKLPHAVARRQFVYCGPEMDFRSLTSAHTR
jgi:hypothetical protein